MQQIPKEAKATYGRWLESAERNYGPFCLDVKSALFNLSNVLISSGQFEEALPHARRLLQIEERLCGTDHEAVLVWLERIAQLEDKLGQYVKAEASYKRALSIHGKLQGRNCLGTVQTLCNFASHYFIQARFSDAESTYSKAVSLIESELGPESRYLDEPLDGLLKIHQTTGNDKVASEVAERLRQMRPGVGA